MDYNFDEWNEKWKSYVIEEVEGVNRLKYSVLFSEKLQVFLKGIQFNRSYWEDAYLKTFYIQFIHPDYPSIKTIFEGDFDSPFMHFHNLPDFIKSDEINDIIKFFLKFDLTNMITDGDVLCSLLESLQGASV